MRYLYKGKTKIGKIHVKTKVDTSFITAGPEDIVAGKKTINGNYQEITGTMDVNEVLTELTSDATASASDITAGKIGYANGKRLVGTTPRSIAGTLMTNSVIDTYPVADNVNINAGDFVSVDSVSDGFIRHNTGNSSINSYSTGASNYSNIIRLNDSKALLIYSDGGINNRGITKFITVNGVTTISSQNTIFNDSETTNIHAVQLTNNYILVAYLGHNGFQITNECRLIYIDDTFTNISISNPFVFYNDITTKINVTKLTNNKCIISYISSKKIYSLVANIDIYNRLVTFGNTILIETSGSAIDIKSVNISDKKVLFAYIDNLTGKICDLSIINDNINIGTSQVFINNTDTINLIKMSNTKFLLLFTNKSDNNTYARLIYYNRERAILLPNATKICDGTMNLITGIKISTNRAFVMGLSPTSTAINYMYIITNPINTINTSIIWSHPASDPNYLNVIQISDHVALIIFNNTISIPLHGCARLLQLGGQITSAFDGSITKSKYVVNKSTGVGSITGIANTSGSSGEIIEVITPSIS